MVGRGRKNSLSSRQARITQWDPSFKKRLIFLQVLPVYSLGYCTTKYTKRGPFGWLFIFQHWGLNWRCCLILLTAHHSLLGIQIITIILIIKLSNIPTIKLQLTCITGICINTHVVIQSHQESFLIINFLFHLFYILCLSVLPKCMCTMCVPGTCEGQKRALDPPELELRMVMHNHVKVGN